MKTVAHAQTWKMDICAHANLDLLDLNVKQVIPNITMIELEKLFS